MTEIIHLDRKKNMTITTSQKNGDIQKLALSLFNLDIEDIQCLLYNYNSETVICGDYISYYSNINLVNLLSIKIISKNETSEFIKDIDVEQLKNSYCTYLISLDDDIYIQENIINPDPINSINSINSTNLHMIFNSILRTPPNNLIDNTVIENTHDTNATIPTIPTNDTIPTNESDINMSDIVSGPIIIHNNSNNNIFNLSSILSDSIINILEDNLTNEFNTLMNENLIDSDLEDVKIVLSDRSFNEIERVREINENIDDINCTICLETITNESIKLKCGHYFHTKCGKEWLCKCRNVCPVCKSVIGKGEPLI
jgi:hypothetical protein